MTIIDSFKMAIDSLGINRTRSALTILGIVIGITAIMMMMSIGKGAENLILNEIGGLGAETIIIRPGKEPTGPSDLGNTLFSDSLKKRDLEFLKRKENVPELVDVMPAIIVPGSVSFEGETFSPDIFGGSAEFFSQAFGVFPEEGVLFDESDIKGRASVAVIGSKVRTELFGNDSATGKYIRIKDKKFRVVGVLGERGQTSFVNFDRVVIVPYTTAQTYLLGVDYFHEIITKATSPDVVDRTARDIEATLREAHNITDPEKDDFFVVTQQGVVEQIQTILGALTAFLSSVVAIALVVGGIGIMNIMLVSVTERTREIGLRKALGATEKDILMQFLFEAILLTAAGGLVGIILGALFSFGAAFALKQFGGLAWQFVFPVSAMLLGLGVSALVGVVFGLYPARKAAQKSPIEALRYE
ncbi:multidrug ABC transporter substrate-binding protein [bacterium]|nr:multidrug ABC transporter substrate-binding protein [bacterium]|tara:strand:- start:65840 stop:67084 length:1245 start_codon:yes stop_codon:yes gene_type:complete